MQIEYTVHTINTTTVPVSVDYNGQKMVAQVNCLEVELLPTNPHHSASTLRLVGDDYAAAKDFFKQDQKLVWPIF